MKSVWNLSLFELSKVKKSFDVVERQGKYSTKNGGAKLFEAQ